MELTRLFESYGIGVMATAAADGSVNTAIYARPHVLDENTLVWGMTDGRTFRNIRENPFASFLFKTSGQGFTGVRIQIKMVRTEEGEMLQRIKEHTNEVVGPGAGDAITHAVVFAIIEMRPLL
ncbi:pyridoxamine 5'-phosphate oxidase family protein [Geomonas sp. RF6]|uniref:pyridoxamine 5'-phosphate oxidase family protein n=1 Tax=Geomonas sp. RF6 TaxID=2897342 RepID=UPI001E53A024|nr:pyridoxamine 5'-phosphate oxidase family protein [Geomonas sp. RF6]UFS72506.1 pyridoxamine 5'-phosphate oxidase family protein [Geomonas sp. RF6]